MVFEHIIWHLIRPALYWVGWGVIWVLSLSFVWPKPENRYKYPVVALLGLYVAVFGPGLFIFWLKNSGSA